MTNDIHDSFNKDANVKMFSRVERLGSAMSLGLQVHKHMKQHVQMGYKKAKRSCFFLDIGTEQIFLKPMKY